MLYGAHFGLDRLRELDPERLLYESTKPGQDGRGALLLTPLKLLDRLAALVPPPRVRPPPLLRRAAANGRSPEVSAVAYRLFMAELGRSSAATNAPRFPTLHPPPWRSFWFATDTFPQSDARGATRSQRP